MPSWIGSIHNADRINLKGESMRKKKTNLTQK